LTGGWAHRYVRLVSFNPELDPLRYLIFILLLGAWGGVVWAADPVVKNVKMVQRVDGSGLVDITYNLQDADGDTLAVALQFSDDGGATWDFPALNCTGDLGQGVLPGSQKQILWNLGDIPETLSVDDLRVQILASDEGVLHVRNSPGRIAISDFGLLDLSIPGSIESFARADLVQLRASSVWQGGKSGDIDAVAEMREINPDIKVVGYVSVKATPKVRPGVNEDLFWQVWWDRTQPYWLYTTEGDTAQDWSTSVLLNILIPECRQAMVETIVEFQRNSLNQLDGIYWDYFGNKLWVPDWLDVEGDPDMDLDGISHWADPDELAAYAVACEDLVHAVRDSMGEDFIQIFNGQRAYADSTFASLADGLMYELYPTLFFPDPDMSTSLDPTFDKSLFDASRWVRHTNGGPYLVLANKNQNLFFDTEQELTQISTGNQFRAVALLLDGVYASWNSHEGTNGIHTFGWPEQDISLGDPLGPVRFEGDFMRRDFRYGRVELEWTDRDFPDPFDYRIWSLGQLVETLAIPVHIP